MFRRERHLSGAGHPFRKASEKPFLLRDKVKNTLIAGLPGCAAGLMGSMLFAVFNPPFMGALALSSSYSIAALIPLLMGAAGAAAAMLGYLLFIAAEKFRDTKRAKLTRNAVERVEKLKRIRHDAEESYLALSMPAPELLSALKSLTEVENSIIDALDGRTFRDAGHERRVLSDKFSKIERQAEELSSLLRAQRVQEEKEKEELDMLVSTEEQQVQLATAALASAMEGATLQLNSRRKALDELRALKN